MVYVAQPVPATVRQAGRQRIYRIVRIHAARQGPLERLERRAQSEILDAPTRPTGGRDVSDKYEAIVTAEFCPACNPCRNGERIAKAERLNEEYDLVLRSLACSLSAGGFNSAGFIDPKVAESKIRYGIDHLPPSPKLT